MILPIPVHIKKKNKIHIPYDITFNEFIRIILWSILLEGIMIGACKLLVWLT